MFFRLIVKGYLTNWKDRLKEQCGCINRGKLFYLKLVFVFE
jgi:hypothetical protein